MFLIFILSPTHPKFAVNKSTDHCKVKSKFVAVSRFKQTFPFSISQKSREGSSKDEETFCVSAEKLCEVKRLAVGNGS